MKALFLLPQIATLFALYLFQDILSPPQATKPRLL